MVKKKIDETGAAAVVLVVEQVVTFVFSQCTRPHSSPPTDDAIHPFLPSPSFIRESFLSPNPTSHRSSGTDARIWVLLVVMVVKEEQRTPCQDISVNKRACQNN
jgi:hypothetical protein